jgi:hypothetical protein
MNPYIRVLLTLTFLSFISFLPILSFGDWTFSQAFYFSLSTLSAGGLYAIPDDSSDTSFTIAAIFAATGIPIAMIAVGNIAKVGLLFVYLFIYYFDYLTNSV